MLLKRLRRVTFVGWDVAEASLGRVGTSLKHSWLTLTKGQARKDEYPL